MFETQQTFGEKIDYDPQWKGPLQIARQRTDCSFLISLGIYLAFWIGIASYAFSNSGVGDLGYRASSIVFGISLDSIAQEANIILGFSFFTVFLSLVYILLLRWFTKVVVYFGILLLCLSLLLAVCILSYAYIYSKENPVFLAALIVSVIIFIVTVIIFIVLRKKIKIACEIIKVSSKVVLFFPSSLLFPILPYILYGIVIAFTVATYIFLSTLHQPDYELFSRLFHSINVFGFFWLMCFVTAFSQMILSGSFATWYWSRNKNEIPTFTILSFMGITIRYHLGTIAFGSLIIAICKFIRFLLNIKEDGSTGRCNPIACLCCGCYKFLFGNLERILRYINRNAYIMSSIHGTKYFDSAKDAFNLLMRNIVKVLVLNKVTGAVLYFGQFLVIVFSALATYGYCINYGHSSIAHIAIISVVLSAIAVTESFFMVLRIAIDTVFLCALEDSERNDGSTERPYFMDFELQALLLENYTNRPSHEENVIY